MEKFKSFAEFNREQDEKMLADLEAGRRPKDLPTVAAADAALPYLLLAYVSWRVGPWWLFLAYIFFGFGLNVLVNYYFIPWIAKNALRGKLR